MNKRDFVIDFLDFYNCRGWYARKDGLSGEVIIIQNKNIIGKGVANIDREDVLKAGRGGIKSGFNIKFYSKIDCDNFLSFYDGEEILEEVDPKSFDIEKKSGSAELYEGRKKILGCVETFTEMDFDMCRLSSMDEVIVNQSKEVVSNFLGRGTEHLDKDKMVDLLSQIYSEMHYLKSAFLQNHGYRDPSFSINTENFERKRNFPEKLYIDFRGQLTGSNWYKPEVDGRWAGPENKSMLMFPSLNEGGYKCEIAVVDEIIDGVLDGLEISVNGNSVSFERKFGEFPEVIILYFEIEKNHNKPFCNLALSFPEMRSPSEWGSKDKRQIALRIKSVELEKVVK